MPGVVEIDRKRNPVPESFAEYLDSLLKTPQFQSSPRRNELLRYLVDKSLSGQGQTLSEYAIALEVFRKPDSFDQRIDSTVRSEISRLRRFVSNYYEGPGAADPWQIVFPPRGYVPEIVSQAAPAPAEPPNIPPGKTLPSSALALLTVAVTVIVILIVGKLIWGRHGASLPATSTSKGRGSNAHSSHTVNPEAQSLYLKGEYYREHRTDGSLREAVDSYTQAIVVDSDYAEAYAGLAASYELMPEYSTMSQKEAFSRGIAAANKALSLDPSISIAHRALAFGLFWSQTDIDRAIREFQEAIHLAPDDAEAHHWYATALNSLHRTAEARKEINIAQWLDPTSRSILVDQAWIRYWGGDLQAVVKLRELEAEEPDFKSPPEFLSHIDLAQANYGDYLEQLHRLAVMTKDPSDLHFSEAAQKGWNAGGSVGMLRAMRTIQERAFTANQSDGYELAHTCALLGEKEQTVTYLQAAFAAKDIYLLDTLSPDWAPALNGYPPFENLRAQVRTRFGTSRA
jgi:hypothetical protein